MNETLIKSSIEDYFKEMDYLRNKNNPDLKEAFDDSFKKHGVDKELFPAYTNLYKKIKMDLLETIFTEYAQLQEQSGRAEMVETMWKSIIGEYENFLFDPASIKYHGSYLGGLFDHSINVLYNVLKTRQAYNLTVKDINPYAIVFHDLCKVGSYRYQIDSSIISGDIIAIVGDEFSNIDKYTFTYNTKYEGIQHGPESLRRLLIKSLDTILPEPWQFAVAYHMGPYDCGNSDLMNFGKLAERHPEVLILHQADMISSKIDRI